MRYDIGGNGFAEAGLMALDYFWATLDASQSARYIPIATNYADFYASHFKNRTSDGRLMIWPSQVLESWWCEWPGSPGVNYNVTRCNVRGWSGRGGSDAQSAHLCDDAV